MFDLLIDEEELKKSVEIPCNSHPCDCAFGRPLELNLNSFKLLYLEYHPNYRQEHLTVNVG